MAKTRTVTRTIVARAPAPTIRVVAPAGGIRARAKRGARRVGRAAYSEKHTLIPIVAAYALGVAKKNGTKLPTIFGLGPAASVGAIAWAIGKYTHNQTAKHAATGLLSVAAYSYGSTGEVAGDGGRAVVYDDD